MLEGSVEHPRAIVDTGDRRRRAAPSRRPHGTLGGLGRKAAAAQRGSGAAGGVGGGRLRPLARLAATTAQDDSHLPRRTLKQSVRPRSRFKGGGRKNGG